MEIIEHILVVYCIIAFATFYFLFGFAIGAGMTQDAFKTGGGALLSALLWPFLLILIIVNYTTIKINSYGK